VQLSDLAEGCEWKKAMNCDLQQNVVGNSLNNAVPADVGYMTGNAGNGFPPQPNPGWQYPYAPLPFQPNCNKGDFNGDGVPDLVPADVYLNLKTWLLDFNNGVSPKYSDPGTVTPSNANGWNVVT
jgi:hypothetical protein